MVTRILAVQFGSMPILAMVPILQLSWPVENFETKPFVHHGIRTHVLFCRWNSGLLSHLIVVLGNSLLYLLAV